MKNIKRQLGQIDPVTLLLGLLIAMATLFGGSCPIIPGQ